MIAFLRRLWRARGGSLLTEYSAALPVLTLLVLAGTEVARFALLNQKMDRLATSMGDLVAQAETLTAAELTSLFAAAEHVAWPFDVAAKGVVIVTSIGAPGGAPVINWQRSGGGALAAGSAIGTGGPATLPDGLVIRANETIIAAEVYFEFTPLFLPEIVAAQRLYHRAFFRPRLGSLNTLG